MTKTLAMEVGSRGIRVNAVAPGLIQTDMIEGIPQIADFVKRVPLGRVGTVDEVAAMVAWLCSEDCSFTTGGVFDISGGRATY